jgi:predicted acyl esterase
MPSFPRAVRPLVALLSLLAFTAVTARADAATVTARGSIGQAYVLGAPKGAKLKLLRNGTGLQNGTADRYGSFIFRGLKPGHGYRVRVGTGRRARTTTPAFNVLGAKTSNPSRAFFKKIKLKQGLNYVKVRDGVELAMTVRLPTGKTLEDGPFPTLIEYSGYQTAAPKDLLAGVVASLGGGGDPTKDPLVPATSTAVGAVVGPLLGFATVSVQMRGSGCSGGAFDLFDLPTTYDGYDAVEAVAAQKWVKGGKVGMSGISFSGITQLFTAGTQPPHLAAIAPMSVTDDIYTATGYPGGIFNSGFALSWIKERMADARPAPKGGQPWARALTKQGDKRCIANQRLRLQTQDALDLVEDNPYRTPSLFEQRAPGAWVKHIKVPTFLIGSFQDEQTGGHFPESLGDLAGNPKVWLTLQNGAHVDALGPSTMTRWVEFLKLYVANEVPRIPPAILNLGGPLYQFLADAPALPLQPSRFESTATVAEARAVFERDPRVRLLMDNGASSAGPGSIGAAWELGYDAWPIREAAPATWHLGPNGTLTPEVPAAGEASYSADPKARPERTLPGKAEADAWKAQPPYRWLPVPQGKGLGFATAPLTQDTVIAGPSSLDLTLKSTAKDTDLQVTLSEVRPDGAETYVQNGWLRASHRKLASRSTALDPIPTHLRHDAKPLTPGTAEVVRVPIFPVAHAFRAGSRIRVTVTAPGGDRPRWNFATLDKASTTNTVVLGGQSRLVLGVLQGASAQGTALPAPTALRGQPSRTYVPAANGG